MPQFLYTIAIRNHSCPHCGAERGENCRGPKGYPYFKPHVQRVAQCTAEERESCQIIVKGRA